MKKKFLTVSLIIFFITKNIFGSDSKSQAEQNKDLYLNREIIISYDSYFTNGKGYCSTRNEDDEIFIYDYSRRFNLKYFDFEWNEGLLPLQCLKNNDETFKKDGDSIKYKNENYTLKMCTGIDLEDLLKHYYEPRSCVIL